MALDVYVGSLTRYYAGDWESADDPMVRERGRTPAARQPTSPEAREKDRDRIQASVLAWRRTLEGALASFLVEPLAWDETLESPWFTDRPDWDGLGSLVLWAAYAEHPMFSRPPVLPTDWDEDPALVRCNADGFRSRYSHLVRNVELWLPTALDFTFEGKDVDGRRIVIGSSTTLCRQLADLNAATWQMDEDEMAVLARTPTPLLASLDDTARHAMAIMSGLVRQGVRHRLPVKLDY